ncbi:MAG TPA: FAD-dependent monooxygenase [Methylibium sp.]|nr:FAD-dependent monooxygenase [Methylibium sp.]
MNHTPVLIAGAGPTGLMLANQLARHGVPFRLVDGKAGPTRESRALGVQARTLELYAALGIADAAVAQGRPTEAVNLYVGRRRVQRLPLGDLGRARTAYPYLLILEQSRNEALLQARLRQAGHDADWGCALERFEPHADGVDATLRHADGRAEALRCDWLVGCDGARSPVREGLGLAFAGGTYENAFYVADTAIDWALPYGEVTVCLSRETFVLFFPMPGGERRYRVIGILPADAGTQAPDLRFEDIEAAVRGQMDIEVRFADTAWFSAYRVHHRCVERLRVGRCLLAGDAAHVHSPVGAQGMNTGLQDACNLGWKLALVAGGAADAALLDSYHAERWPLAQRLLRSTDNAFRLVVSRQPLLRWLRLNVVPPLAARVMSRPAVRRWVFGTVSQIGLGYHGGPLARGRGRLAAWAGERLPHAEVGIPPRPVHGWLAAPGFHVLLLARTDAPALDALAASWQARLGPRWPGCLQVHALDAARGGAALLDALGADARAAVIVRPDQYIGIASDRHALADIEAWFDDALGLRVGADDEPGAT